MISIVLLFVVITFHNKSNQQLKRVNECMMAVKTRDNNFDEMLPIQLCCEFLVVRISIDPESGLMKGMLKPPPNWQCQVLSHQPASVSLKAMKVFSWLFALKQMTPTLSTVFSSLKCVPFSSRLSTKSSGIVVSRTSETTLPFPADFQTTQSLLL